VKIVGDDILLRTDLRHRLRVMAEVKIELPIELEILCPNTLRMLRRVSVDEQNQCSNMHQNMCSISGYSKSAKNMCIYR
jgi:hypothetical protein